MNENKVKFVIGLGLSAVAAVLATKSCIHIHREEKRKREVIRTNMNLDLTAIARAHDVMMDRIDNGEIRSITQLAQTTNTEIAFQKIAVREDQ